jgi:hypothetical protein
MFGRKKDENLEEYNEKYASKYDDDYIAPSKEYRSECDHDHEQSYSNINTVRECEHDHEQTYNDADTEQKPYDDYVNIENFFEKMLYQGEHLLWVGSRWNAKVSANLQLKQKTPASVYIFLAGVGCFILGFCFLPMLILGIVLMFIGGTSSKKNGTVAVMYAVTDQRVIISNSWEHSSISMKDITKVEHSSSSDSTGNVYITTDNIYSGGQKSTVNGYVMTLQGISDPARVEGIINDAIHGFF